MTDTDIGSQIEQSDIRFLIEKNADGIIVVDEAGLVLFANPAAERLFGQPSNALIGSPIGLPIVVGDMSEIAIHQPGGGLVDAEIRTVETSWGRRPARLASIRDVRNVAPWKTACVTPRRWRPSGVLRQASRTTSTIC
jgi:PAS domain-containing protein